MADLFISYAREDQPFVRRLDETLQAQERATWVDWKDIPPTDEWMARIQTGIEEADNFVFVISPDSVASEVCNRELSHAVSLNKRLIPILRRPVEGIDLPDAVARLNWIYLRAEDDFDARLDTLLQSIDLDLAWVRAHTRLTTRAVEWAQQDRDGSYLLRGDDLDEAEAWLGQSATHEPPPTALQTEYILAGRRDAVRRQRVTIGALATGLIVISLLAVVAYTLFLTAEERSRVNLARLLASEAQSVLGSERPQRRLLLATEAVKTTQRAGEPADTSALNALLDALGAMGGVGLPLGGGFNTSALSPDGKWAATVGSDSQMRLWDLTAADPTRSPLAMNERERDVTGLLFTPDSERLISVDTEGSIVLQRVENAHKLLELQTHAGAVLALAIEAGGRRLATAGEDGIIVVYDVTDGGLITPTHHLESPANRFVRLEFSPDGRWLLAEDIEGGSLTIFDLDNDGDGYALESPPTDDAESEAAVGFLVDTAAQHAFSLDGRWLATTSDDDRPLLWNLATPDFSQPLILGAHEPPFQAIGAMLFTPNNRWFVTGGFDKRVHLWDMETIGVTSTPHVLEGHDLPVSALAVDENDRLATGGGGDRVYVWDLSAAQPPVAPMAILGSPGSKQDLAFSSNTGQLFARQSDAVTTWAGDQSIRLYGHDGPLADMTISDDGHWLLTRGFDGSLRFWDLHDLQPAAAPRQQRISWSQIEDLRVDDVHNGYIARTWDGILYRWSVDEDDDQDELSWLDGRLEGGNIDLALSADGRWLAGAASDGVAYLWDLDDQPLTAVQLADEDAPLSRVAFSPDANQLAAGGIDGRIELWTLSSGSPPIREKSMDGHSASIVALAFSADGETLFSADETGTLKRWSDSENGQVIGARPGQRLEQLLATPDGRWLLAAYDDSSVERWRLDGANVATSTHVYAGDNHLLRAVTVNDDSHWLAVGTHTGEVRLWSLGDQDTAAEAVLLRGHEGEIVALAFDAAGERLFSASWDGTVRIWDLTASDPARESILLKVLVDPPRPIGALAVSESLGQVLAAGTDGTVYSWPLDFDELTEIACRAVGRNLTDVEWAPFATGESTPITCPDRTGSPISRP